MNQQQDSLGGGQIQTPINYSLMAIERLKPIYFDRLHAVYLRCNNLGYLTTPPEDIAREFIAIMTAFIMRTQNQLDGEVKNVARGILFEVGKISGSMDVEKMMPLLLKCGLAYADMLQASTLDKLTTDTAKILLDAGEEEWILKSQRT